MTVTVLVVDDSGFFRRRLGEMINASDGLKVVGTASNGAEAIDQTLKLKPDVITMDYEMPVMDGISAVKQIMSQCPTPILMFSSLTYEGARVTLDSLAAGAVDYMPKNFEEISQSSSVLKQKLAERILTVAGAGKGSGLAQAVAPAAPPKVPELVSKPAPAASRAVTAKPAKPRRPSKNYSLVAIGTSTGGPVALQNILTQLPADYPVPIVLIQHMPSTFTQAFAERLNSLCRIKVLEARDGDSLIPGIALLAPGGKQLMIGQGGKVKVLPGDERLNYKPSVDITFGSAANVFGDKVLGVILTGMGSDGCEGAKLLKQKGASIWAQDKATSVIYGMPMAVARANLTDEILPLPKVGARLCEVT
ncbi:MAG: chemotaxis response regulator protein-glutamate methylesterase [Pseudomonadales bacterium]